MSQDPVQYVKAFIEAINSRDVEALHRLMTEDHMFVDAEDPAGLAGCSQGQAARRVAGLRRERAPAPDHG